MATDRNFLKKDIPLSGKLITSRDPSTIASNFKVLQNMKYTDSNPQGIGGMTKINTTALSAYPKIRSGFHFSKDQPTESHVLVQAFNSGLTASVIYDNTTAIPGQGDFAATALLAEPSGSVNGIFSLAPGGNIAYCNKKGAYMWGGNELRVGAFINYDPGDTFRYDYTEVVRNTLATTAESAVLNTIAGGIDANTMLLLHLDNNVTDSSPTTAHTVTNVSSKVTFSTTAKVFGTHAAVFNGTDAYLTIPDNADFDFSGGTFTIDTRANVDNLTANQVLYYQKTDIESAAYTSGGTTEIVAGVTITGATSGETAIVDSVVLSTGTWAGGDAAGTIYVHTVSGAWTNGEGILVATVDCGTLTADFVDKGDNYILFQILTTGAVQLLIHECYGSGSDVVDLSTAASTILAATWYHIQITENGSSWYIFVDGALKAYASDASRAKNYISVVQIGYENTNYYDGGMDEYRVSNTARNTSNFDILIAAYSSSSSASYLYLGSTRPLKGFKFYIGTANTSASTMSAYYWDGSSWIEVTSLADNTSSGGKSLAVIGTVTFTSTDALAKVKILNGTMAYWYKVNITAVSANTSIYHVTVDAPFQKIKDIWDGVDRTSYSFKTNTAGTWAEYTTNVYEDYYDSNDTGSYAELDSLPTSTGYMLAGFIERQTAISISIVANKVNTTANTILTVKYWNGFAWTSVGSIEDGTSSGGISFAKSGLVSWSAPDESSEFTTEVGNEVPLYYYKFEFSQTFNNDVQIYYLIGIPAQKEIKAYSFPVYAGNSVWLFSEQDGYRNKYIVSAFGTADVWNGEGSITGFIGDESDIVAGSSMYVNLGSNLYEVVVVCKKSETWMLVPTAEGGLQQFMIDGTIGCVAPQTMRTVNLGLLEEFDVSKNVVIWQGSDGVYAFDGKGITRISEDIQDVFDSINRDKIDASSAFEDIANQTYHWCFASGTSSTLNKEYAYDKKRQRWFTIERGTAKYLQCGFISIDTVGNFYTYGGLDSGYVERLENGTDFDGTDIAHIFHTGDMILHNDILSEEVSVRTVKLICLATNTTTSTITGSYYKDGLTTVDKEQTFVPQVSGKRIAQSLKQFGSGGALFHSFKFSISTNDEAIGFEPIFLSILYKWSRQLTGGENG